MKTVKMLKVIIMGDFWDSYLYRDCLFLFDTKKIINIYNWTDLITKNTTENDNLANKCAFLNSDYLYTMRDRDLFKDKDFKNLMINKINDAKEIMIDKNLFKYICSKPIYLEQLTIDIGFYNNRFYYCDSRGLFYRNLKVRNKNKLQCENELWDGKIQSFKIGLGGRIALSLSSEGLYEYNTKSEFCEEFNKVQECDEGAVYKISDEHSTSCDWAYNSLVNNSYIQGTHIFTFKNEVEVANDTQSSKYPKYNLVYDSDYGINEIFENGQEGLIVANNEKIYKITNSYIESRKFNQKSINRVNGKSDQKVFEILERIDFWADDALISAQVAEFGIIIETTKHLFVIQSNSEIIKINENNENIVRWRIFPRSNCYANQLHVIYNDRLEILSFNNDCFIDDANKVIGNEHFMPYKI